MTAFLTSTLANDQKFTIWNKPVEGLGVNVRTPIKEIIVHGKQSILKDKNVFATPCGAATTITDEELTALQTIESFNHFVERGFISVSSKTSTVQKATADMTDNDLSNPVTESRLPEMTNSTLTV